MAVRIGLTERVLQREPPDVAAELQPGVVVDAGVDAGVDPALAGLSGRVVERAEAAGDAGQHR